MVRRSGRITPGHHRERAVVGLDPYEETAIVSILLAGALATVVGVLMWQGVWAGLAAAAFLAALFAMTREQRR